MNIPSSEWTDDERLQVVNTIAARCLSGWQINKLVDPRVALDVVETIQFLSGASKEFLEANREKILALAG